MSPEICISCRRRSGIARNTPLRSIVCGPCWFAGGCDISPSELTREGESTDEASIEPPSTLLPRTALEWYRGLLGSPWYQERRRDAAARLRGLLEELARRADWDAHTTWPTWERLQAASGWRRSSTAAWLAELQRQGWLLRVEGGSTARYRPMALQHLTGNRAAVYQLRIPAPEAEAQGIQTVAEEKLSSEGERGSVASSGTTTWTPTHSLKDLSKTSTGVLTRANTRIHSSELGSQTSWRSGPNGPGLEENRAGFFDDRIPVTRSEMLAAAAELRSDPALRRLTPRWIRSVVRPWWQAGWTNSDLRFALEHQPTPDGPAREVLRCPASQLRSPDGWLRHRLKSWRDARGPLVSPTIDARRRSETAAAFGQASTNRLPYGAAELSPADLAVSVDERDTAQGLLVRRWALEFHARRNEPKADDEVASPESRRRSYLGIRKRLDESRGDATGRPRTPVIAEHGSHGSDANEEIDPVDPSTGSAHERALARAREARGNAPRRIPSRHRSRRFR